MSLAFGDMGTNSPATLNKMPTPDLTHWQPVPLPKPITLYGRTVMMEPLDAELHAASLWNAIQGHNELWTWMGDGPYTDEESFRTAIAAKQAATNAVFFAILSKETGRAVGYASLMRFDPQNGVIEVGNILLSPALQRTTTATEAMYLMAKHVFEDLGYRRYEWKCNAENTPSRRAAERLGFTFEGIFRQHQVVKGRNRNTAWLSMLDHEWPARKRAFESWLAPENFNAEGRQHKSLESF
jgi:RimJ/RimL family protein N-acetyltransferase